MLSGIACAGDLGRPGLPGSVLYFVLLSRALARLRKDEDERTEFQPMGGTVMSE